MSRTLVGLTIVVVAVLSAACGGAVPTGASGDGANTAAATSAATSAAGVDAPGATAPETTSTETTDTADDGGLPENELSVEDLCAALTAEELGTILGETVTIDPAETEWCGYDSDDGSGMFMAPFGNPTAEDFTEQVEGFDCDAKSVEGGAILSSCGADKEEGRPTEAWFLLDGVGVQLSVDTEATEAQYLQMIREALD